MKSAPKPNSEKARLKKLRHYQLLDSLPEEDYDRITRQASLICDTPIALVSLIDSNRQWFKSKVGLAAEETPRDLAFCAHAILAPDNILVVKDTLADDRFSDNPLVTGDPKIRFYAGVPLQVKSGDVLGTLCVIDKKPRDLTPQQMDSLRQLGSQVVALIELRSGNKMLRRNPWTFATAGLTVFMLLASLLLYQQRKSNDQSVEWVRHTYETTYYIQNLLYKINDAEMNLHRYRLSSDVRYLENYKARTTDSVKLELPNSALANTSDGSFDSIPNNFSEEMILIREYSIAQQLQILRWLIADNTLQRQNIQHLEDVVAQLQKSWEIEAQQPLRQETEWASRDNFFARRLLLEQALDTTSAMAKEENRLLTIRNKGAAEAHHRDNILDILYVAFVYIAAVTSLLLYRRSRQRVNAQLEKYIALMEQTSYSLNESNQHKNAILSSATHLIVGTDLEGKITLFNRQAERKLGYTAEEVLHKKTPALWHDPDELKQRAKELSEELGQSISPGLNVFTALPLRDGSETTEWTFIHKDGSRFTGSLVATPIRSPDGSVTGYFGVIEDISKRKEAETERTKLLSILDNAPDYIGVADLRGNLQYHNRAARILAGLPDNQDMSQLKISDMHPQWANTLLQEEVIPTVFGKGVWVGESAILHRDGHEVPVSQMLTLYRDAYGEPAGFATIMRDITSNKLAEEALRKSEGALQLGWQGTGVGMWDWEVAANRIEWSDRFNTLLGFEPGELPSTYEAWAARLHADDKEMTTIAINGYLSQQIPTYDVQYRLLTKSGEWRWYHATGKAIWDAEGNPQRMVGSLDDITERVQAEKALRISEETFRAAIESSAIGVALVALDGKWLTVNKALCDIVGYREEELMHIDFQTITHPDDLALDLVYLQQMLSREIKTYHMQKRYYHKDGHIVWVLLSVSLVWDNENQPKYFVSQIQDISELVRAEEDRKRLLNQLTQSNTDLERFAYVASHDMQEPLRMIANFSGLIVEEYGETLDESGKEYIALVKDSATRMQDMIEDLLAYARVKNDETRFVEVDAKLELNHVLVNLSALIEERKAAITYDVLPHFTGNPVQFMRLLQNLISNGLKYQEPDTIPKLHLAVSDEGDHWCFSVSDNGIGINEEFVNQVFEPFKRLHSWDEIKGSGIGLAVCKQIVERHSGKIWATSVYGKGSVFYFTIAKSNMHWKEKDAA